ncbi:MAG: FAD-dependent monooxygenase [Steroidobacteraceae bacterium]
MTHYPPTSDAPTTIIVGAGIGGLAAALALLRAGHRVRVLEQSASLGEVGAGLSITPNASKALAYLGLTDELAQIGSTPAAGSLRHYRTGEDLVTLPQDRSRERYGYPLYHVHRADLHRVLLSAVTAFDNECVMTSAEFDSFVEADNGISVCCRSGWRESADYVIGADGIHSRVRAQLFGPDRANFTGYVAWRGLIPGEKVTISLIDPPLCMTLGPRRMLMRYPLRRGSLINFVAIAKRNVWMEEGWSVRSTREELLEEFADFEPRVIELLSLTSPDRLYKWGLFDRDPLPSWTRGRVTLLGDAAHAMPPFTGQGAVMALEDAAVLGRAAQSGGSPEIFLKRYQDVRISRVTSALAMSRARADLYFGDEPAEQVKALTAGMAELRTLYDYDAGAVDFYSL